MTFSFFNSVEEAAANTALQYASCDLTRATYANLLSSLIKAGVARAIAPIITWHVFKYYQSGHKK